MQNRVYVIYIYVCMVRMPFKRTRGCRFPRLKHGFLDLTPLSSDTTALKQVLLETWAPNCEIIPLKCSFFKSQKVTANGYYGIETLYQT